MHKFSRPKVAITKNPGGGPEERFKAFMPNVPGLEAKGSSGQSAFAALRLKAALYGFEPGERNFQLVLESATQE